MSRHTPGPWLLELLSLPSQNFDYGIRATSDCVSGYVCFVNTRWVHGDQQAQQRANARLISAAPELLESCERALAAWEGTGPAIILDELRAAIAKATGEQS